MSWYHPGDGRDVDENKQTTFINGFYGCEMWSQPYKNRPAYGWKKRKPDDVCIVAS